jgi:hypothetical protein
MSDVRLVRVDWERCDPETIHDDPDGTHLLVSVGWVGDPLGDDRWGLMLPQGTIKTCPTCGGGGMVRDENPFTNQMVQCTACNGRGWVLAE